MMAGALLNVCYFQAEKNEEKLKSSVRAALAMLNALFDREEMAEIAGQFEAAVNFADRMELIMTDIDEIENPKVDA